MIRSWIKINKRGIAIRLSWCSFFEKGKSGGGHPFWTVEYPLGKLSAQLCIYEFLSLDRSNDQFAPHSVNSISVGSIVCQFYVCTSSTFVHRKDII